MLHRKKIKKSGFRLLESSELALIAGGDAPPNPALPDPNAPPGFGDPVAPFISEDGKIISDSPFAVFAWGGDGDGGGGGGGNVIVVTADRQSDSSSGSGSSSSGAPSPQGYDVHDPTSHLFHTLNALFADQILPNVFDTNGDGQGDWIIVNASEIHTVTDSDSNSGSTESADIYACIGGGEVLVGGVCGGTGAFDLYVYGGFGLGSPIEGLVSVTSDSEALLTGPALEVTSISGGGAITGPEASGFHIGTPGVSLTNGFSVSDLIASLYEAYLDAREEDKVEQAIEDADADAREAEKVERAIEEAGGEFPY